MISKSLKRRRFSTSANTPHCFSGNTKHVLEIQLKKRNLAAHPCAGGTGVVKDTNQYAVQLLDGHTFNIYVKAGYFNANSEINTAESAPSNTITVSTLPPVAPTPSISATVIQINDPVFGPNFGLLIEGSNFGKSEQVSITVTRTIAGDSGSLFALGNFTTDDVFGGFSTTFTNTAGLCPIDVPIGQPQPVQNFSLQSQIQ
jgi:hypothetical protein